MTSKHDDTVLPIIPDKRYFTIGEVSELCAVKPHVLRYWEQEFTVLKPTKRRGNRRYYQHKDVLMVRQIRELLYDRGFTINGARVQLTQSKHKIVPARTTKSPVPDKSRLQQVIRNLEDTLALLTD